VSLELFITHNVSDGFPQKEQAVPLYTVQRLGQNTPEQSTQKLYFMSHSSFSDPHFLDLRMSLQRENTYIFGMRAMRIHDDFLFSNNVDFPFSNNVDFYFPITLSVAFFIGQIIRKCCNIIFDNLLVI
jgi:hypothetical protein